MHPYGGKNTDGHDGRQAWDPSVPPYSSYTSQPGTVPTANLPSQDNLDPNQRLSSSPPHRTSTSHASYGPLDLTGQQHQAASGDPENSMHFPPDASMPPQGYWQSLPHGTGVQPSTYSTSGQHVALNRDTYGFEQAFSSGLINSSEGTTHDDWMDSNEDRRPTITQHTYYNELRGRSPMPLNTSAHPIHLHYSLNDSSGDSFPEGRTRHPHRGDEARISNARSIRRPQGPYEHSGRVSRPLSLNHAVDLFQPPSQGQEFPFTTATTRGIAIPPPPMAPRQSNGQDSYYPARDASPYSRSLPARSPHPDWSLERSGSSAATPASTEGSADPAQSDQDEYDPRASTSTSPQTSMSSSTSPSSSTASRWARFRVPADIYMDPFDPVRHELYHQVRTEDWFLNQAQERPITTLEASRIPGSISGESILLAFYDRVTDSQGKSSMRCTICMKTNPQAQLYPRPDRAKVHMRHHFELRPIPCNGKCETVGCTQRFFTTGDLGAHVTGKTEPLATCEYCRKTMRAKNLKRHITHFCHRAPQHMRGNRRA